MTSGIRFCSVSRNPVVPAFTVPRSFKARRRCHRGFARRSLFSRFAHSRGKGIILDRRTTRSGVGGLNNCRGLCHVGLRTSCLGGVACSKTGVYCKSSLGSRIGRQLGFRLRVVGAVKFPNCFLVIRSFVQTTHRRLNISINPNHKSTTNSTITCYLKVAHVSPVGCSLLFRHFLGPSHVSLPSVSASFSSSNHKRMLH